jgi:amidase
LCFATWKFDGGEDVHAAFGLSGEPMAQQVAVSYGDKPLEQNKASEIMAVNISKRECQKEYMEFWNNSAQFTTTGRPVDAVISPCAPFAAARPAQYYYYGYTTWVNLLDYTSVVVPVLRADKSIDKVDTDFKPLNDIDKLCHESYDPEIYDGAKVSVQFVGRRLQEEKMLAIADIATAALNA